MNKNILIVLGGAVLAAVLVAALVQVTLGGKKAPQEVPQDAVEVLVAAQNLKAGHELKEGDMRWQAWPGNGLFKGTIVRKEEQKASEALKGRLERSFQKGEPLVQHALLKEGGRNYVAARLEAGERAVSIKVSAQDMVAGFISPGSYVDVILTYKHRVSIGKDESPDVQNMVNMNIDKLATETILENVRVLAIDQQAEQKEDDKIKVGKTVTLAVPIRDAEKLALASEMGTLTLAMRGVGDDLKNKEEEAITDARLTTIDDEIHAEYQELIKETGVTTNSVRVYNGAQVQTVPVR